MVSLALTSTGCVPFLVPPARVETGIGTRVRPPKTRDGVEGSRATGMMRAGLHPLQLIGPEAPAWADFAFGYRSEWVLDDSERPLHGPYAELGLYPVRPRLSRSTRLRFGGYTSADAILTSAREPGLGATLGTLVELTGFSSGAFGHADDEDLVGGVTHGQWAVGLFASSSFRNADDRFSQTISTGLSFRMPFVVGIACCAWPGNWSSSTSEEDSSEPRPASKSWHPKRSQPEKRRDYEPARPRKKQKD